MKRKNFLKSLLGIFAVGPIAKGVAAKGIPKPKKIVPSGPVFKGKKGPELINYPKNKAALYVDGKQVATCNDWHYNFSQSVIELPQRLDEEGVSDGWIEYAPGIKNQWIELSDIYTNDGYDLISERKLIVLKSGEYEAEGYLTNLSTNCGIEGTTYQGTMTVNKISPPPCTYTIYKKNVRQSLWDALNSGNWEEYIIVRQGPSTGQGVVTTAADFLNPLEYDDLLDGICVPGSPPFVITDEVDGN